MGGYSSVPSSPEAALGKVKGPAMAIMVIGGLGILACIAGLIWNLFIGGAGALGGNQASDKVGALMTGGIGIASNALGLIVYGMAIFGGLKMSKLESYTMAWVGTVAVALPCACCCFIGIPIAIWSAVVLMNDEVKNAFAG
jgi:hypothetical protein